MSCIDLMFCTNKYIISYHGVNVTIFEKCHHNIIYSKINIRVSLYIREAWSYSKTNIENIKKQYPILFGLKLFKIFLWIRKLNCLMKYY